MARVCIFLTVLVLIAGIVGCGGTRSVMEIRDWYDLDAIRDNLSASYILMNDLDSTTVGFDELASPGANEGKGWEPIGTAEHIFTGTFNGQGHEIVDLFIDRPDAYPGGYSVGLFGDGRGGIIENVGVVNVTVIGNSLVGGLVGFGGTVRNSYSTGSVTGEWRVGGLMGDGGNVSNSYSSCNVTGNEEVGGLIGDIVGTVSNSYSTGNVSGNEQVGGLVGAIWEGTVSSSYSAGNVTGNLSVGGLVGYSQGGNVTNSFWDTETSGLNVSDGGTSKTTAEMKDISTFSGATWDMVAVANPSIRNLAYIWNIVDTVTYPFLSWQP